MDQEQNDGASPDVDQHSERSGQLVAGILDQLGHAPGQAAHFRTESIIEVLNGFMTIEELEKFWAVLEEDERRGAQPAMNAAKQRILEKMDKSSPLLNAVLVEGTREEFRDRHAPGFKALCDVVQQWQIDSNEMSKDDAINALHSVMENWLYKSPRRRALLRLSRDINRHTLKGVSRTGAEDVYDLRLAICECIGHILLTEENALDAFAEAFAGAKERIDKRRHALEQHAPKKAVLAEAWQHFKKARYTSLAEGARACANHYRGDGMPTYRAFLDYFRQQAKAEGMSFKPGRKPKPEVAKKPLKRAA